MGDRCTGRCCRDFRLPFTPASLHAAAARERARRAEAPAPKPGVAVEARSTEIEQIASMVCPVRPEPGDPTAYRFSCVHLDEDGDCAIYEHRPDMCRDFPYGHACFFGHRCDWDAARAGEVTYAGRDVRRVRDSANFTIQRVHLRVVPQSFPELVVERDDIARADQ